MTTKEALEKFLESRRAKNVAARTILWYRIILERYAAIYPNLPDDTQSLEGFIASCQAGDERKHGYYRALKAFYRWLARRKYLSGDIIFGLDHPQRSKKDRPALDLDQLAALLEYPHEPIMKGSLIFLADTGSRLGELHSLEPGSFYKWGKLRVVRISGKTGARVIPVSEICYQLLKPYIPFRYKTDWLGRLISQAFKDAGVPGTAHTLRHTFGTLWEGDIDNLQRILGHSTIATTMIYRHIKMEALQKDHALNSPLKRLPKQMSLW